MTRRAILPDEVDFEKFGEGQISRHNDTDFSIPLLYLGQPLIIETNFMKILFGLTKYSNPDSVYANYSLSLALNDYGKHHLKRKSGSDFGDDEADVDEKQKEEKEKKVDPFVSLLQKIDRNMMSYVPSDQAREVTAEEMTKYKYENPVRSPQNNDGKKTSHLRVKIPSNRTNLRIDLYENYALTKIPSIKYAESLLRHGVFAKFQLELKPIWFSTNKKTMEKKYGYSWQVIAIQIQKATFN